MVLFFPHPPYVPHAPHQPHQPHEPREPHVPHVPYALLQPPRAPRAQTQVRRRPSWQLLWRFQVATGASPQWLHLLALGSSKQVLAALDGPGLLLMGSGDSGSVWQLLLIPGGRQTEIGTITKNGIGTVTKHVLVNLQTRKTIKYQNENGNVTVFFISWVLVQDMINFTILVTLPKIVFFIF